MYWRDKTKVCLCLQSNHTSPARQMMILIYVYCYKYSENWDLGKNAVQQHYLYRSGPLSIFAMQFAHLYPSVVFTSNPSPSR